MPTAPYGSRGRRSCVVRRQSRERRRWRGWSRRWRRAGPCRPPARCARRDGRACLRSRGQTNVLGQVLVVSDRKVLKCQPFIGACAASPFSGLKPLKLSKTFMKPGTVASRAQSRWSSQYNFLDTADQLGSHLLDAAPGCLMRGERGARQPRRPVRRPHSLPPSVHALNEVTLRRRRMLRSPWSSLRSTIRSDGMSSPMRRYLPEIGNRPFVRRVPWRESRMVR